MNDDYLKEMKEKRLLAEKMGKIPRKKRKKRKRADYSADNAHDAALNVVREKNISNKINLKALEALFPSKPPGEGGSTDDIALESSVLGSA
jgi:hypothetical protein